jgi:hypothetical protein
MLRFMNSLGKLEKHVLKALQIFVKSSLQFACLLDGQVASNLGQLA